MKRTALFAAFVGAVSAAQAGGLVDFDGTETGLLTYTNPVYSVSSGSATDALNVSANGSTVWGAGDSLWPMTRAAIGPNGIGMPFNISDDSVAAAAGNSIFTSDVLGFAGMAKTDGFMGITDTENPNNTGPINVDFVFDISGDTNIVVSVDIAAMGDFEAGLDFMDFSYSLDGGPLVPLFTSSVNEAINQSYTMDSGATPLIDDPMLINGVLLNDVFQTFSGPVAGTGSTLRIHISTMTDGAEGFGFDNLSVVPEPASLALLALGGLALLRRR